MRELYRPLKLNETPILFTGRRTSELIKYAANAFLAMKITFINEMADLCEAVGADVQQVARGIGLDKRIGSKFLNAGPGYGGSCFPKDTLALVRTADDAGSPVRLVKTTVEINDARKKAMAGARGPQAAGDLKGKTVAILGLTFKPNTDDMRDAPSLDVVPALLAMGATVRAFDPEGMEEAAKLLDGRDLRGRPLCGGRGRGRGGDPDRMGPVPRAGPGPGQDADEGARHGGPAQCLPARGHAGARVQIQLHRAGLKP